MISFQVAISVKNNYLHQLRVRFSNNCLTFILRLGFIGNKRYQSDFLDEPRNPGIYKIKKYAQIRNPIKVNKYKWSKKLRRFQVPIEIVLCFANKTHEY